MYRTLLKLLVPFFAILSAAAQSAPPSQLELNGFLLGQYDKACDGQFGKAARVIENPDFSITRSYIFDEKHQGSMTFSFPSTDPNRIRLIQISGAPGTPMRPFLGLVLGDPLARITTALGYPNAIEPEPESNRSVYRYTGRNYLLEVDEQGRLAAIRITGYAGFPRRPSPAAPDTAAFREHLQHHSVDRLMEDLAGDVQIFRNNQSVGFGQAARHELSQHSSEFVQLLFGGVHDGLGKAKSLPEPQLRVTDADPTAVVKFEKSNIREVVYKLVGGRWRVSEISLQ